MRPHIKSVDLVVETLPPEHDAIGEYTACLARELARSVPTRILTNSDSQPHPVVGVTVDPCFQLSGTDRFAGLRSRLRSTLADAVVIQYNPFAWGRRGWAPDLVKLLRTMRRVRVDVRFGVMFHERYMTNPGWRSWLMRQYQRRQFHQLMELADICFFSTGTWADEHSAKQSPSAPIVHLPVGSNLPECRCDRVSTRKRWEFEQDDFVCGTFGGAHPSRMVPWIELAVRRIADLSPAGKRVRFVHVGGGTIPWELGSISTICTGRVTAQDAANAIGALDLLINPFTDGVSTRRTSVIAGLQQGVPILTTIGSSTEDLWSSDSARDAVFAAPATSESQWIEASVAAATRLSDAAGSGGATRARMLFKSYFSWPMIAQSMIRHLDDCTRGLQVRFAG